MDAEVMSFKAFQYLTLDFRWEIMTLTAHRPSSVCRWTTQTRWASHLSQLPAATVGAEWSHSQ